MMAYAMGATQIEFARLGTERFERFPAQLAQRHGAKRRSLRSVGSIGSLLRFPEIPAGSPAELFRDGTKPGIVRWRRPRNDLGGLGSTRHGGSLSIVDDHV